MIEGLRQLNSWPEKPGCGLSLAVSCFLNEGYKQGVTLK
jgi:hypothetical protein